MKMGVHMVMSFISGSGIAIIDGEYPTVQDQGEACPGQKTGDESCDRYVQIEDVLYQPIREYKQK